jgi:transcriptional antiterminator RfaH
MSRVELMKWHCLRVGPHKEAFVTEQIMAVGMTAYYPKYQRWIKHARQRTLVLRPLFPNYIFVQIVDEQRGSVARMRGVQSFVGGHSSPAFVPDELIQMLKSRENNDGLIDLNHELLKSGDMVNVMQGPFTGLEAVFIEYDDKKRVHILIEFLGKFHRLKMDKAYIEKRQA